MHPGADGQERPLAVFAQRAIVTQLPGQKDIVPPGHQMDRHRDILNSLIKTALFPVWISWLVMCEPLLKERSMLTGGKLIEIAQRQACEKGTQLAAGWK